jgi:hypothetical protein
LYKGTVTKHVTDEPRLWRIWLAIPCVAIAGLAVLAGSAWLLWHGLGSPSVKANAPMTTSDELDLVRIGLVVTGGVGGLVALVVAYRRQRLAEDANMREVMAHRQENYKLFNELYTDTATLLGDNAAPVRQAGIYGMARLADGWPRYRQACVDVICAYLRTPPAQMDAGEREVRRSALRLINKHLDHTATETWHDCEFDLAGVEGWQVTQ